MKDFGIIAACTTPISETTIFTGYSQFLIKFIRLSHNPVGHHSRPLNNKRDLKSEWCDNLRS